MSARHGCVTVDGKSDAPLDDVGREFGEGGLLCVGVRAEQGQGVGGPIFICATTIPVA